jgi:hypothetical protein
LIAGRLQAGSPRFFSKTTFFSKKALCKSQGSLQKKKLFANFPSLQNSPSHKFTRAVSDGCCRTAIAWVGDRSMTVV